MSKALLNNSRYRKSYLVPFKSAILTILPVCTLLKKKIKGTLFNLSIASSLLNVWDIDQVS